MIPVPEYFDTHTHLADTAFAGDLAEALRRAREAGVSEMLVVATDLAEARACLELASREAGLYAAIGISPEAARRLEAGWEGELESLIREGKPAAIGECGLDAHYPDPPLERQIPILRSQLEIARRHSLPLVLHSRRAAWEVLREIEREGPFPAGGVFHCAEADEVFAQGAIKAGFHLGFGGTLTYPRNDVLRKMLARLPRDRILLETDCPYLTPQPVRGRRNEPAYLVHVAERAAEIMGISAAEAGSVTGENARRLFAVSGE